MTTIRPSFLLMTAFFAVAAAIIVATASPLFQVAAQVIA